MFAYLKSIDDLQLRLESFDATSVDAMSTLATSIRVPVGGCFISTLVLKDGLFNLQTQEMFHEVSDLKINVLKAFGSAFNIHDLDFFVTLSSLVAVIGNAGQSNYAA